MFLISIFCRIILTTLVSKWWKETTFNLFFKRNWNRFFKRNWNRFFKRNWLLSTWEFHSWILRTTVGWRRCSWTVHFPGFEAPVQSFRVPSADWGKVGRQRRRSESDWRIEDRSQSSETWQQSIPSPKHNTRYLRT